MREALEQVRQQFTEGHSDKDFKPYPDWKKTAGGRYPRFKHSQKGEIEIDRYGEWLHSDKSGKTIAFYRNHFPKTNTTGGTSMKLTDYLKKINEEVINEVSDHEVSMARGELEAIAVKATHLAGALQGKSDEGNPLEAWVQSKITKAKDYINSVSDYLMYNPDMKQNEETLEEKFALYALRDFTDTRAPGGMRKKGDRASGPMTYTQAISKAKQMNAGSSIGGSKDVEVRPMKEDLNEKTYGWTLVSKAKDIAKKFKDNITKAVAEIEKLEKGLSKNPTVDAELRKYNENLEEKYTVVITKKDGSTMELGRYNTPAEAQRYVDMYGKGAKVKKEEVELDEIDEKISDIFKANKEGESIEDIAKKLKLSPAMVKKLIGEDLNEQDEQETDPDKIALAKEKDTDTLERQLKIAQGQINVLKQKIENEKNKAVKPLPNPETGEVPLTIGIAHKVLRDMKDKEEEEKKQKEASKQIQNMAKGGEETKLESFTKKYLSHLNESEASDKAKAMGLTYMSFGRYGKDDKVTHKSVGGSLKALSKKDQEKDSDVKPTKPKTKTTGSIKNKDGSNTTSGSIKKEILKKIEDEDLTDPEILANFDVELTNLADDLAQTGDKETADKILDALSAVEEGDIDPDAPSKIDDMMNALNGKPDINSAKKKELSQMTSLYTDAKYSDDNVKDFVNDTASIINKMSEVAEAGSMDSDAYGPGIRSDAMTELVSTCSEIQDKIEDMDLNDDIKRSVVDALETITDRDTDEFSEEGDVVMSIENLKYNFKKLAKENKKERKSKALQSSGKKSKVTSDVVDVEPRDLKKQAKKYGLTVKIGSGDPDEGYEVEFKGPKKNILKYYKKYMGYDGDDFEGLGSLGDIDENKIIVHKTIIKEETELEESRDFPPPNRQIYTAALKRGYKGSYDDFKSDYGNSPEYFVDIKTGKPLKEDNLQELEEVTQKEIDKFHTDLDNLVHKTFGHSSKEKMDEKVASSIIKDLQKAYAPMKGKTISPEMATKISKHLDQPSYDLNVLRQLKKADIPFISTIARNKIYKKTGKFEDRRLYVEGIAGLQKKADKSGMPYNILKQVYDRGMAAWKSGHRPGASQQQWAFARVNSFITKSSGTWGGADKDLAAKVKGSK
jgi:hypothetical protein